MSGVTEGIVAGFSSYKIFQKGQNAQDNLTHDTLWVLTRVNISYLMEGAVVVATLQAHLKVTRWREKTDEREVLNAKNTSGMLT